VQLLIFILGDDDATTVRYIELCMGETRRCQCGHFFKLVDADAEV